MKNILIASLQVQPQGSEEKRKQALLKIEADIEQCGLRVKKQSFDYVIEGNYEQITRLFEAVQLASFNAGADEIFLNIRIHSINGKDLKLS